MKTDNKDLGIPRTLVVGGCQINHNIVPISLLYFNGLNIYNKNILHWETASEVNNNLFIIEHSIDGFEWCDLHFINGAGNSNYNIYYEYNHIGYENVINYYRLTQIDYDGKFKTYPPISIDNREEKYIVSYTNLMGQEVDVNYRGMVIILYSDGTTNKTILQ